MIERMLKHQDLVFDQKIDSIVYCIPVGSSFALHETLDRLRSYVPDFKCVEGLPGTVLVQVQSGDYENCKWCRSSAFYAPLFVTPKPGRFVLRFHRDKN